MGRVNYQVVKFNGVKGIISCSQATKDVISDPLAIQQNFPLWQTSGHEPQIVIQRVKDQINVTLVLTVDDWDEKNDGADWSSVDSVDKEDLQSLISFLYNQDNHEEYLFKSNLARIKSQVREYLSYIRLETGEGGMGWPCTAPPVDQEFPEQIGRVGWNAYGQAYRKNIDPIGTSIGVLTSLLSDVPINDVVVQDSVQSLHLLQKRDGGWSTEDSEPVSIIPATTYALRALHQVGESPESPLVQKALAQICELQQSSGGWRNSEYSETETVFSTCRALQIIKLYGSDSSQNVTKGILWLKEAQAPDGGWGAYSHSDKKKWNPSTAAHTAHCLQTLAQYGMASTIEAQKAVEWLSKHNTNSAWEDSREFEEIILSDGSKRSWWYTHTSTPWSLYALLLAQGNRAISPEVISGALQCLSDLDNMLQSWRNDRKSQYPMWPFHDNLMVLNAFSECLTELDASTFILEKSAFKPLGVNYNIGLPVKNKDLFVGRQKELMATKDHFAYGRSDIALNVYGHRKIGKTSFLYRLLEEYSETNLPIILDMQRYMGTRIDTNAILFDIAEQIYRGLAKTIEGTIERPSRDQFKEYSLSFLSFLDEVENLLGDKKLILIFDEFECWEKLIEKQMVDGDIYRFIRHLMTTRDRIGFVFASTHRMDMTTNSSWSVFLGGILPVEIGPLDSNEVKELIITYPAVHAESLSYTPASIQAILELSGGQAYLCQAICYQLVQFINESGKRYFLTKKDIENIVPRLLDSTYSFFSYIYETECDERQRSVLENLASSNEQMTVSDFLGKDSPSEKDEISQVLQELHAKRLINIREEKVEFAIGLFKHWLKDVKGQTAVTMYMGNDGWIESL